MQNKWFKKIKSSDSGTNKIRLFCFPHAGGSANTFKHWEKFLPKCMELYALQLPGRGDRFTEELITSMELLIDHAAPAILELLDIPYIFLGHSFGALVAFELARKIKKLNYTLPSHLFIMSMGGPKVPPDSPKHNLSDIEIIEYLKSQSGTDNSILNSKELLKSLLPIVRADLKICETYFKYYQEDEPLKCPIHVFWANEHELNDSRLIEWKKETLNIYSMDKFDGHHFFLHENTNQVVEKMYKYIGK